jgi:hypothetical protein
MFLRKHFSIIYVFVQFKICKKTYNGFNFHVIVASFSQTDPWIANQECIIGKKPLQIWYWNELFLVVITTVPVHSSCLRWILLIWTLYVFASKPFSHYANNIHLSSQFPLMQLYFEINFIPPFKQNNKEIGVYNKNVFSLWILTRRFGCTFTYIF